MDVTLLGSGDAIGMPVPLCDCDYCRESDRRRRPALLVETEVATVLFDAGPDLAAQLRTAGVSDLDAAFLTHAHHDHAEGVHALAQAGKWPADHLGSSDTFEPANDPVTPVYLTETAESHLRASSGYLFPMLQTEPITPTEPVSVADLRVRPFAVEHARPTFETVGFVVEHGGDRVAYAPDAAAFRDPDPPAGVDFLFVEGAALFGTPLHGPKDLLESTIETAVADRVVLLNLSEHKARAHTSGLQDAASASGYELGRDFATYRV